MPEPKKNENNSNESNTNENGIDSLASEMYHELKQTNKFLRRIVLGLFVILAITIAGLIGTHIYHIYQWSMFDAVVVDSGEGSGNANYVQGDNTGGIYNGESSGALSEEAENSGAES